MDKKRNFFNRTGQKKNNRNIKSRKSLISLIVLSSLWILTGCAPTNDISSTSHETLVSSTSQMSSSQVLETSDTVEIDSSVVSSVSREDSEEVKAKTSTNELANLEYQGEQTIVINNNEPSFTPADLSLDNGAWEEYGDLDDYNRVTEANAMLNQSIMPTQERGDISSVKPTGWKNKKIKSGYLFNRSHLIGHALAGEDANVRNLMTGTRQLNSPEMLRHEMDVKYYLDQSPDHYVRYSVTPIFKDDELLARGVQMQAQSVNDDSLQFNVFIFNVQDGVTLDYADGSSQIDQSQQIADTKESQKPEVTQQNTEVAQNTEEKVLVTPTGKKYHVKAHGRGNFTEATLSEALARGLEPCNVCY